MTATTRRTSSANRRAGFDLRSTALFFVFLAMIMTVLGFAARMMAGAVERRPAWVFVLFVMGVAGFVGMRRRIHVARAARRAAAALDHAAREAAGELESLTIPRQRPATAITVDHTALTPEEFEEAIAALCERDGCSAVEVVGGAGDLGADVLAVTPDGRRVVIQCKRYGDSNRVGSQDLQRFGGTCFTVHEADIAALVTTSDFTAPALEYADRCGIVCMDRESLQAWTDGTGPEPWEIAQGTQLTRDDSAAGTG
ncbi:restriction endonuclease [Streptomyces turgidiscabies]|uniref:Restriction endonuclease n=1 Tax=Streptomyces turgidiscabies (strain Car8) TaxID=698760 RepID=L7F775_STRT8|nr:restriction endonuclease [Streptomyces turgidiscabies]ELP66520.1 restriction endonuclease [Streptomyces turgidiscabies Car8]MDX3494791.1 restriction endonuclease [Streptomyces turgidiscabies]GAQ71399.1 restriction endonuclease [Streptomyces turgidiscabies]